MRRPGVRSPSAPPKPHLIVPLCSLSITLLSGLKTSVTFQDRRATLKATPGQILIEAGNLERSQRRSLHKEARVQVTRRLLMGRIFLFIFAVFVTWFALATRSAMKTSENKTDPKLS